MDIMRIDQNTRAALAVCGGIFVGSSVAVFFMMRLLLNFLAGSVSDSGVARDVIDPLALLAISSLGGVAFAVVFFSNVKTWIKENGLPGFIPPPDKLAGQNVRVSLQVRNADGLYKEEHSMWVTARHISNFLKDGASNKLILVAQGGNRLVMVRTTEETSPNPTFLIKLTKRRRTVYSFELSMGHTGVFEKDEEQKFANCFYKLAFVGCTDEAAWLKFGGEYKIMEHLFLK